MAEIVSNVYDIVYPSPATLQEISSIAVVVRIWRSDLEKNILNDALHEFFPAARSRQNVSLSNVISNLPSTIVRMIKKHHTTLVISIDWWLQYNYEFIFKFNRGSFNAILSDFNDIACDFDGAVHYDRTAKRMLNCDRISLDEKFLIACTYCFEDDIRQILPSVESEMDILNKIRVEHCPYLHYWVCHIRNEMDKISNPGRYSIEEISLRCNPRSRSTFEYFWNRVSLEKQSETALKLCFKGSFREFYTKLIVPKLNEQQIAQFLKSNNVTDFFLAMIREGKEYVLPIWMRFESSVKENIFKNLARELVLMENDIYIEDASTERAFKNDEILMLCCDVWNNTSDHLKRAAIKYLFDGKQLIYSRFWKFPEHREIRFLFVVLSDTTLEKRLIFWHNNWLNLLKMTCRTDFLKIMKLCLNERQICEFKETTLSDYENIKEVIKAYVQNRDFHELKDLVDMCCPDQNSKRILYRNIFKSNFFSIHDFSVLGYTRKLVPKLKFIEDVYTDDPDFATNFSTDVLSPLMYDLTSQMEFISFEEVMQFFDATSQLVQNLDEFKEQLLLALRSYIISGPIYKFDGEEVQKFLFWCLGNEEEIIEFKRSVSPDQVLRNMLRNGQRNLNNYSNEVVTAYDCKIEYPQTLDPFLFWYFATSEEIKDFKIRLANVFVWIKPPVKNMF